MLPFTCQDEMIFIPACDYEPIGTFHFHGWNYITQHFMDDIIEERMPLSNGKVSPNEVSPC